MELRQNANRCEFLLESSDLEYSYFVCVCVCVCVFLRILDDFCLPLLFY